ncbi:MAG: DUF421 domain-containing protein [Clostridia bacterium]|nr:DUF421 domain-containing protein [Clostridia bacterium]
MLVLVIRTVILYLIVVISMRIMGKRQIGEMQPSELVVAIMISDLASVPMQAIDVPLLSGVIPVFSLIVTEIIMSYIGLKSRFLRKILTGEPSVIIYDGHVNERELKRLRFNLNDLLEQLRINNVPNISDVEVAMLETNGQISIIPKREARNVTVRDMKIKDAVVEKLPCTLISDGELIKNELRRSGYDEAWLDKELKKRNINSIKDVFIASYDINDGLFIQLKGEEDIQE